jgi:hypothetical protein
MGFLQPLALLALSAASLPALLHLLARRVPPTVTFPAVRYLAEAERRHQRRLKLRNLLLLLLRTALIVLLVLAWARPVAPVAVVTGHAPSALAVIVDNSLSSGAVVDGRRLSDTLAWEALRVISRVTAEDRLWLVLGDGEPRAVTPGEARAVLENLAPVPVRLDLGDAVRTAARLVADDPRPGEIVVVSDLQASAVSSGAPVEVPVLVWAPPAPPGNRGIDSVRVEPPVWFPSGAVTVYVGGTGTAAEVVLEARGQPVARGLASPGEQVTLAGALGETGWVPATVSLTPDELRADDQRHVALYATAPAVVRMGSGTGGFLNEAVAVLMEAGRVRPGAGVTLADVLGPGVHVVIPPTDPGRVGDLNRALAARGIDWRLADRVEGEWVVSGEAGQGARVFRRHRLLGRGDVIARVGNEPWLVRTGDVVLLASRLDEAWTDLPVTAGFVPFVDHLLNRVAARPVHLLQATAGQRIRLPDDVEALAGPEGSVPAPADRQYVAPLQHGVTFLIGRGADTVGAVAVHHDPRESRLEQADRATLRAALGPTVQIGDGGMIARELFAGHGRAELAPVLLLLALAVFVTEFAVASATGRVRES